MKLTQSYGHCSVFSQTNATVSYSRNRYDHMTITVVFPLENILLLILLRADYGRVSSAHAQCNASHRVASRRIVDTDIIIMAPFQGRYLKYTTDNHEVGEETLLAGEYHDLHSNGILQNYRAIFPRTEFGV